MQPKASYPTWEDFVTKGAKLQSHLRTTITMTGAFLDAFQKVADMATGTRDVLRQARFSPAGRACTLLLRHPQTRGKDEAEFREVHMSVGCSPSRSGPSPPEGRPGPAAFNNTSLLYNSVAKGYVPLRTGLRWAFLGRSVHIACLNVAVQAGRCGPVLKTGQTDPQEPRGAPGAPLRWSGVGLGQHQRPGLRWAFLGRSVHIACLNVAVQAGRCGPVLKTGQTDPQEPRGAPGAPLRWSGVGLGQHQRPGLSVWHMSCYSPSLAS
ncbi:Metastasis suppressor protein 1 [Takifugu flavidus]|uniref:Metastasis suppressor protein 1 n=1 Tax=Takifugu flavidus TaxID=433684 RepID=A0A5C6N5B0_9TELE|nr:Metastasis suppressor protein 1 [Takifugu flavidus]